MQNAESVFTVHSSAVLKHITTHPLPCNEQLDQVNVARVITVAPADRLTVIAFTPYICATSRVLIIVETATAIAEVFSACAGMDAELLKHGFSDTVNNFFCDVCPAAHITMETSSLLFNQEKPDVSLIVTLMSVVCAAGDRFKPDSFDLIILDNFRKLPTQTGGRYLCIMSGSRPYKPNS